MILHRDPGDQWVEGPLGKFWGKFGSAGIIAAHPDLGVLLQHRAEWSHHGGTWGIPGGATLEGEDPITGALREANEETGIDPANTEVLFTSVYDIGYWKYTTVAVRVLESFTPVVSDPESIELRWVMPQDFPNYPLHPGFESAWPKHLLKICDFSGFEKWQK